MKRRLCACALLLVTSAGSAEAKGVAWCQVNGANYAAYLSGIVEVDDGPDAFKAMANSFGKSFRNYIQASLDRDASNPDCTRQDSRFYADDYIDVLIKANPGYKFVKTGWRGNVHAASATAPAKRGGGQTAADSLRFRR
ncbi:MAG: hypothetical protein JO335_01875 [Sphingomonas sp.]|nr:hypothetical protein [Sphingomonas sp.]